MPNTRPQPFEPDELTSRQQEILRLVQEHGFATIETLARHFDVSAQTVRRDIIRLDEAGILQRFHGGAGVTGATSRLGYAQKQAEAPDAKARIAGAVAAMVPNGSSLFLDVGTTAEAVARALSDHRRMHVVTNSLSAASILAEGGIGDVIVTGGLVRGPDGSLVGEQAQEMLSRFRLDVAVIACSGFDEEDGAPMDFDVLKIAAKQTMAARARRVVVVADAAKFTRAAVGRIMPLDAVGTVVTDAPPPAHFARLATEAGCRIVLAGE